LAQIEDPRLKEKGAAAAAKMGLDFEYRFTGYGELQSFMKAAAQAGN
jgi:hypothetical protein